MSLLAWNGVLWLAWGAYWLIVARRVKATKSAESFFDRVKHLAPLHIGFFLIFWWPPLFTGRQLQHAVLAWLGMALTIAGLAFAVWARLHLGGNWSGTITLKEGHELIRSGPYHFVRHPIYTGFLTALLGSALIAQSVEALIGFVIVVIALVLKLRREDKLLTQEFGDRYVAFMAEVAALVPFLYQERRMAWLALDIGGANLKAADGRGWALSVPFALWRQPEKLADALAALVAAAPPFDRVAVTMTGELCDCFRTKADGVRHILAAMAEVASGRECWVYLVDGQLVTLDAARERPELAAASNWHALATFVCRYVEGRPAVLIDIGSTTTDIVPLVGGRVESTALTDTQRLMAGELVYSGVGRTPVCAVVDRLPYRGGECPVAAELFATTADAYLLLGQIDELPDANWTADGRPLLREFSIERLGRMLCADRTQFDMEAAFESARAIRDAQLIALARALDKVLARQAVAPECFIVSGAGEFLARELIYARFPTCSPISLEAHLGASVSACAPAHAAAVLAAEMLA